MSTRVDRSEKTPLLSSTTNGGALKTVPEAEAGPVEAAPRTVGITDLIFMYPETRWRFYIAFSVSVLNGSMFPAFSIVFGSLFESFYSLGYDEINKAIIFWTVAFAVIAVGTFIFMFLQVSTFGVISEILADNLRRRLFNSLLQKDVAFFDSHNSGQLTSRLQADMTAIQAGCSEKVGQFVQNMSQCALGIAIALFYGWQMTLVLLAVAPLMMGSMALMSRYMQRSERGSSDDYADANIIATETLASFRTILAFTHEDYERHRYAGALSESLAKGVKRGYVNGVGMGVTFFILFGIYALGFWYGGRLVVVEKIMTPGSMLTVFFAIVMGSRGIGQGMGQLPDLVKARVAAGAIFDLMDTPCQVDRNEEHGLHCVETRGDVQVDNVQFTYPTRKDNPVLKGVSFCVRSGQTIALVGSSGSGKSSILQLLMRFYDPDDGRILLDGQPLNAYKLSSLRRQIGLVSQEPTLFSGTIMDNIRYGRLGASDRDVFAAAQQANAHDFITRLVHGYNTQVGEKGTQLSGGQKQRVAIARAILKNPRILLLDEATSALDTESEKLVQDALNKLMANRTTIIVAHRLSTIQDADQICYLNEGQITESGTHDELLELRGGYFNLIQRQTWTADDFSAEAQRPESQQTQPTD